MACLEPLATAALSDTRGHVPVRVQNKMERGEGDGEGGGEAAFWILDAVDLEY